MQEALVAIGRALDLMTWSLMFIVFLTFLSLMWSGYIAYLVRREGIAGRRVIAESHARSDQILKEMREDSKRMQFYLFSKFGPAELK